VLGLRVLIYCHGDDLVQQHAAERRARRRWFDAADLVVAAGSFPARQLTELYGVARERVAVLPNGVDLARFRPLAPDPLRRAALGLEQRRVILTPTRLVRRKGVDRLVEALPAIRARHPDVILLVVGDGPQRAALEQLAAANGGADAVRFTGAVPLDEMPSFYALAEVVVLPNRAEQEESDGTPLVFLEANACGRPVIGGRAGGTPDVVEDGCNGLLVDGEDPAAIAAAVLRVLRDGELAARLTAGALAKARTLGWKARALAFLELCRRV
jgi:phosphatidylinositol alpha-1,6-mannosyltransferase